MKYREYPPIQGHCPACGHRSLFLGSGGYITCSLLGCRWPTAAADLVDADVVGLAAWAAALKGRAT